MGIGNTLSQILKEKNTNANELAVKLGVTPSTIYSIIRRDNMKINFEILLNTCSILDVSVERFYSDYARESFPDPHRHSTLSIKKYHLLNEDGRKKIDEAIEDLLRIQKYQACCSVKNNANQSKGADCCQQSADHRLIEEK